MAASLASDHLIFIIGITILVRQHFYTKSNPCSPQICPSKAHHFNYLPYIISKIKDITKSKYIFVCSAKQSTESRSLTAQNFNVVSDVLTHWGRVTHICANKLIIIGSDNGLSPGWRQAIIWTNDGILLIGPLGTNFIEISIKILTFSFTKIHLKVSSAKWRPFCLGLKVLNINIEIQWPEPISVSSM